MNHDYLLEDDVFAAVMARVKYSRYEAKLPKVGETREQANYWMKYYNGIYDAKKVEEYIDKWKAVNKK